METFLANVLDQRTLDFYTTFMESKFYLLIWEGILWTLGLTTIALAIGITIGLIVAIIKLMEPTKKAGLGGDLLRTVQTILKWVANTYVFVVRGTPTIVQAIFMWSVVFATSGLPRILIGGIAFGFNSGAYMAELIRAGIQGIDKGQMEAGRSLGFNYAQTMSYIILPQAIKQMLPAFVSEFIVLIKETSVVGYIGGMDITKAGNQIIGITYNATQPLLIVALCYLVLTGTLTLFMKQVEKKIGKSH